MDAHVAGVSWQAAPVRFYQTEVPEANVCKQQTMTGSQQQQQQQQPISIGEQLGQKQEQPESSITVYQARGGQRLHLPQRVELAQRQMGNIRNADLALFAKYGDVEGRSIPTLIICKHSFSLALGSSLVVIPKSSLASLYACRPFSASMTCAAIYGY